MIAVPDVLEIVVILKDSKHPAVSEAMDLTNMSDPQIWRCLEVCAGTKVRDNAGDNKYNREEKITKRCNYIHENLETCNFSGGRGKSVNLVLENLRFVAMNKGMKKSLAMSADLITINVYLADVGVDVEKVTAKYEAFLASIEV
jgi:hypothetical protein